MYCISFSSVVGKAKMPEDLYPQWRRMAWSDDGQMLAVSSSTGSVTLLDIMGGEFFTLTQVILDACV